MKFGHFSKQYDGTLADPFIVSNNRLDFAGFQKVYPGHLATGDEIKSARVASVPDGHSVWKTNDGRLMAIRNE